MNTTMKDIIVVTKKGRILPVKLFDSWWKCSEWCNGLIEIDKADPTQYDVTKAEGFKKYLYALVLYINNSIDSKT